MRKHPIVGNSCQRACFLSGGYADRCQIDKTKVSAAAIEKLERIGCSGIAPESTGNPSPGKLLTLVAQDRLGYAESNKRCKR